MAFGVALWALAAADGGIDLGETAAGAGPTAAFLSVALLALLAALALVVAPAGALAGPPARVAVGSAAGLAVWSALSIVWAAAPDLAWLEANRAAGAACALLVGAALAARMPRAPAIVALAVTLAAGGVAAWALADAIVPTLTGRGGGAARLSGPLGYWNALGVLLAMGVPGVLWAAGRARRAHIAVPAAAALVSALVLVILMSYSRGSLVALGVAAALVLLLDPARRQVGAVLAAAAAGVALPASFALSADGLTTDGLAASARRTAGMGLGWRLVVGLVVAALVAELLRRYMPRRRLVPTGRRELAMAVAALLLVGGVIGVSAGERVGDWIGDRVASLDDDVVANDPSRFGAVSPNQRLQWSEEAGRAFLASPLTGEGAGGFRLTHLRERDRSLGEEIRHPHQLTMQIAGELGLVGVLLVGGLVGGVAWGAVRMVRRRDRHAAPAVALVGAFAVHTQLDWTWSVPAVAVPALLAAGTLLAAPGIRAGRSRRRGSSAVALTALAAGLVTVSALLPWLAARQVAAGYGGGAYGHAATARSLNPLSIEPDILEGRFADAAGDRERALEAARRATRDQPENPRAWRLLAEVAGTGRDAAEAATRLAELDPHGTPAPTGTP